MITLIRLELLRIARDRRFWFWSLVGVPIILPAVLVVFLFAIASFGTVEPQAVRPVLATDAQDEQVLKGLEEAGIPYQQLPTRQAVVEGVTDGLYSVGLVNLSLDPGAPLAATLVSQGRGAELPVYRNVEAAIERIAVQRRKDLIDSLDFHGPSFDLLVDPLLLSEERAPNRLPSGLSQVVALMWGSMLVFPYLLLTWNGGSRAVTDRQSGYLAALNASAMPAWKWLLARWTTLSSVGAVLLLFSAALFLLYMRAYAAVADLLVAEGVLEGLSEYSALSAKAYLVHAVSIWRETSFVSLFFWVLLAVFQLAAICALVLWGSVKASSLAQYRLFELLPFAIIFLLPLVGLGALGSGVGPGAWIPGLNTVLSIEHVVSGGLPSMSFFSSAGISLFVNALLAAAFLSLSVLAVRNERLWCV